MASPAETALHAAPPAQTRPWTRLAQRATPVAILVAGSVVSAGAMLLTFIGAAGQTDLWENTHWTVSAAAAAAATADAAMQSSGRTGRIRTALAVALACYLAGQILWDVQWAFGIVTVPAASDIFFLATTIPALYAFVAATRGHLPVGEGWATLLDSAIVFLAITTAIVSVYGKFALATDPLAGVILLAYPIAFLAVGGAGVIGALATREPFRPRGAYVVWLAISFSDRRGSFGCNSRSWSYWRPEAGSTTRSASRHCCSASVR